MAKWWQSPRPATKAAPSRGELGATSCEWGPLPVAGISPNPGPGLNTIALSRQAGSDPLSPSVGFGRVGAYGVSRMILDLDRPMQPPEWSGASSKQRSESSSSAARRRRTHGGPGRTLAGRRPPEDGLPQPERCVDCRAHTPTGIWSGTQRLPLRRVRGLAHGQPTEPRRQSPPVAAERSRDDRPEGRVRARRMSAGDQRRRDPPVSEHMAEPWRRFVALLCFHRNVEKLSTSSERRESLLQIRKRVADAFSLFTVAGSVFLDIDGRRATKCPQVPPLVGRLIWVRRHVL